MTMNRRKFIKASLIGVGASGVMSIPGVAAVTSSEKAIKSDCRLDALDWVTEPSRKVPVIAVADVVVLGGGPAGVAAAVCAARGGASVILLERYTYLGGLWTGGLVLPCLNTHGLAETKQWTKVIYGFSQEIYDRLLKMDMVVNPLAPCVDPEACKYVLEQMCVEAGVQLIYHNWACGAGMSGDKVDSILLETKSGRVAVRGSVFVDASGDGDLFAWAGEDYSEMRHHIGAMYRIGGVPEGMSAGTRTPVSGVRNMHMHGVDNQDGLDVLALSRLQTHLRGEMWNRTQTLRRREGGEGIFLLETPPQIGVRVTRVLNAVSNVTLEGSMHYRRYEDSIGMSGGSAPIKYRGQEIKTKERPVWQIPYSALIPKRCPNLIVAGRCFGFDEGLVYDAREIGTCLVTGQAAGTAAALALNSRCSVQNVDVKKLQSRLVAQNVKLEY